MKTIGILCLPLAMAVFAGCGGTPDRSCDEVRVYQRAVEGRRIQTPADLSGLDGSKEIPMPEISPAAQREPGSPCLDRPPAIIGGD